MINPVKFIDQHFEEEEDSDFQSGEEGQSHSDNSQSASDSENKILKQKKYNSDEELIDGIAEEDEVFTDSENEKKSAKSENEEISSEEAVEHIGGFLDGENLMEADLDMENYTELDIDKMNELLFCAQGIGKFTDDKKTIYEKARFSEASMRDIHRFLRKDDPENPKCRNCILTWRIAENDIIPLLLTYENNEKIQQLGLVILIDITEGLPDIVENRSYLESMLSDLQEFIANSQLIDLLSRSLADSTAKLREAQNMRNSLKQITLQNQQENKEISEDDKKKSDEIKRKIAEVESKSQTNIELVFALLKQILNITCSKEIKRNVNCMVKILNKFADLKIFDAIVFHSQNFKSDYYKRLSTTLLELIYYLVRPFSVNQIFELAMLSGRTINNSNNSNNLSNMPSNMTYSQMSHIQRLKEEERQQKILRQSMMSNRPNNFGTTIKVTRPVDNTSFIVTNVNALISNKEKLISEKMNEFTAQRKKPKRNRKPRSKGVFLSQAGEEIKLVNDLKISENFFNSLDSSSLDMVLAFKTFCSDFITTCLNNFSKFFFEEIKLNERIEKYDVYHLLGMITFFLDFHRYNEYTLAQDHKKNKSSSSFEFNYLVIKECINYELLEFSYSLAYKESMKNLKKELKLFELYSSIRYLKQVLLTSIDLYKYKSDNNLQQNILIQDSLITKDFSKIIKAIYGHYNENYYPRKLLFDCIELTEVYYSCLDLYSSKRKLKIKIKKKTKRGKIRDDDEEEEMKNFIEKNPDDDDEDSDNNSGSKLNLSLDSIMNQDKEEFLERDLNVSEEMRTLLNYAIISRILSLFSFDSSTGSMQGSLLDLKRENPSVIKFISKIFDRITHTIKQPWIFYQMEYLYTFHALMNDQIFSQDLIFQALNNSLKAITKSFFETTRKNKLLAVESLFRFISPMIKDEILNNYEVQEVAQNFADKFDEREFHSERGNDNYNIYDADMEGDVEYDGTNVNLVRVEEEGEIKKKKLKKNKQLSIHEEDDGENNINNSNPWTESEDLMLIKNYLEFKDHEEVFTLLENLFTMKTKKEIKSRVKILKLKKGEEKALRTLKKLHKDTTKSTNENMVNVIMELADLCRDDLVKQAMENTISSIKEQLESYRVRKGLLGSVELECNLIPTSDEEIEIFRESLFQDFIQNIGLIKPSSDDGFWKVNSGADPVDIGIIVEKLTSFEALINDHVEQVDPEREREKEIAKKQKKLRKSEKKEKKERKEKKHKKDKKEKKKRKRSFEQSQADFIEQDDIGDKSVYSDMKEGTVKSNNNKYSNYQKDKDNESMSRKSIVSANVNEKYSSVKKDQNTLQVQETKSIISKKSIPHSNMDVDDDSSKKKKKRLKKGLRDDEDDFNFD
jgi:uncharacterized protein YerC